MAGSSSTSGELKTRTKCSLEILKRQDDFVEKHEMSKTCRSRDETNPYTVNSLNQDSVSWRLVY
jgi:hypothetical protein